MPVERASELINNTTPRASDAPGINWHFPTSFCPRANLLGGRNRITPVSTTRLLLAVARIGPDMQFLAGTQVGRG